MITTADKSRFIDYCLEFYPNNGRDSYLYLQIENQEEEREHIAKALPILLEYFLKETTEIIVLGEDERWLFFDYIYGDFDIKNRNVNDLLMVFKNGNKKKIYNRNE